METLGTFDCTFGITVSEGENEQETLPTLYRQPLQGTDASEVKVWVTPGLSTVPNEGEEGTSRRGRRS